VNVPAGNIVQPGPQAVPSVPLAADITPTATLQWSLGGNTIYRKISVFSGASISGVCEQLVASVSDETVLPNTFQVGNPILVAGKNVLGVNTIATADVPVQSGLVVVANGVALDTDGMTVLLNGQTVTSTSGPWMVHAGAWGRLPPLVAGAHASGAYMLIAQGTFAGKWYALPAVASDVVGTDNLVFQQTTDPTFQIQYSVTIVGGEGTRPATALPPAYQNYLTSNDLSVRYGAVIVTAAGFVTVPVPQDIGVTSVMITAGSDAGVINEAVTANNFIAVHQSFGGATLKEFFPLDYSFVPVSSQTASITVYNFSAFEMQVSFTWGIDG
jgi:hypothetical protein